jgi:hypothetical protein
LVVVVQLLPLAQILYSEQLLQLAVDVVAVKQ